MPCSQRSTYPALFPQPENDHNRSSLTYSSPIPSSESKHRPPVGLGISGCGIEHVFDEMRVFNIPPQLPSQLVPQTPTLDLSYDDYTSVSCFAPSYDQIPIPPPESLGLYGSTSMSASPSYNSAFEAGPSQDIFSPGMSDIWTHASCSGPTTPSEAVATSGNLQWMQGMAMPATPQSCTDTVLGSIEAGVRTCCRENVNAWQESIPHQAATTNTVNPEPGPRPARRSRDSLGEFLSASGKQCPTCGKKFTRRSNCKEHQKMHNPEWKHNHPCEECHKSFGRSSDLKRHRDNVSPPNPVTQDQRSVTHMLRFISGSVNIIVNRATGASADMIPSADTAAMRENVHHRDLPAAMNSLYLHPGHLYLQSTTARLVIARRTAPRPGND
ncbi:unnamed protein product [Penicillium olsonii]|nr:unnamed protein product [Penicillium olsonii]